MSAEPGDFAMARAAAGSRGGRGWIPPAALGGHPAASEVRGARVAVVGAGLSGLTAAACLHDLGAIVEVFEAAPRAGGRVLTLRDGDILPGGSGARTVLPPGQAVEAGAARIHPFMVAGDLVRQFGVGLRPVIARNDDAFIDCRYPRRQRDWWQDVHRLSVQPDVARNFPQLLNDAPDAQDPHRTRQSLPHASDVGDPTGAPSTPGRTDALDVLLDPPPARALLSDLSTLKSAQLLAVVGGTDQLVARLVERIPADRVHLDHELRSVVRNRGAVSLTLRGPGGDHDRSFDRAVLTLAPHRARSLDGDLPSDLRQALGTPVPRHAVKVFLTYPQRWWEQELGIFGGTSYPAGPVTRLWYPSDHLGEQVGGTLVAYCVTAAAEHLDSLTEQARHETVVRAVADLHPEVAAARHPQSVSSVSWRRVPEIKGAWVNWPSYDHPAFHRVLEGSDRVQFAGDWLHPLTAWMSGAFASATAAVMRTLDDISGGNT
jgi:monoamine oxidase